MQTSSLAVDREQTCFQFKKPRDERGRIPSQLDRIFHMLDALRDVLPRALEFGLLVRHVVALRKLDDLLDGLLSQRVFLDGPQDGYRIGGDEFAVVLPNHTRNEAVAVAERLRREVNATPHTAHSLTLSVSLGIAAFPDDGIDLPSLRKSADLAAYDAKNLGRNLVRFFGEQAPKAATREPERRTPDPGGVSDSQRSDMRRAYFRDRTVRCPNDEALMSVQDLTAFGDETSVI